MSANINSLVGYGLSSDSDSDGEGGKGNIKEPSEDEVRHSRREGEMVERRGRNLLLESGSGSSESESEPETPAAEPALRIVAMTPAVPPDARSIGHKLPPPPLGAPRLSASGALSGSSVFANPFRERAEEHLNMLQKHVPLTLEPRPSQIGGRKICISYRRDGRCRFGSSCKFGHDSDLQTFIPAAEGRGPSTDRDISASNHRGNLTASHAPSDCHHNAPFLSQPCVDQKPDPDGGPGRKRRVGLSDTLTPPKRALKQYASQRERERVTPS
ncbi:hypothetical protein AAFF_G00179690 [Aldrovandia affinis]|uniref:C3H1-type domain-containing protein n=1 Tax=Aldrovandia affinis TaxID=143900 RepID=A0AAD7SY51_9TELE|nr:hypothetical protein AAFF_G00179690 [Aldrovandia affinis]